MSADLTTSTFIPENANIMAYPPESIMRLEHVYRYARACNYVVNARVIDAACGFGYGSLLMRRAAQGVYGIDHDHYAIAHASHIKGDFPGGACDFACADLETIVLPECDVVVSFETTEHLKDAERWMAEMKRVARRVIYSVPIVPTKDQTPHHLHDFTMDDVQRWCDGWGKFVWVELQANTTAVIVMDKK